MVFPLIGVFQHAEGIAHGILDGAGLVVLQDDDVDGLLLRHLAHDAGDGTFETAAGHGTVDHSGGQDHSQHAAADLGGMTTL